MTVRVRVFASLRERLGRREMDCHVAEGATVADLWQDLCAAHPGLTIVGSSISFAVNHEYVEPVHRLRDGDELAVIPPVSGG